jgi:hypothetical protein
VAGGAVCAVDLLLPDRDHRAAAAVKH